MTAIVTYTVARAPWWGSVATNLNGSVALAQ
jgi:hypothetical protein